jgi:hypothetical protein
MAVWEPGSILVLVRGGMAQVDCAVRLCCMWVNFFDCLQNSSFYLRAFSIEMVRYFLLRLLQWPCLDTPAGLELELVSNSSSSSRGVWMKGLE